MKLSAPIHRLKSQAKALKRDRSITMSQALNEIAKNEGYSSWSLLQSRAKHALPTKTEDILGYLHPGDLMLIGSRPGKGKTTFALEMLLQASRESRKSYFFSLEYTPKDLANKVVNLGSLFENRFINCDFSDEISANYIIEKIGAQIREREIIAIDYLQLLDQKRTNPDLQNQVETLKELAKNSGCIILFISQVDRSFDADAKAPPEIKDLRLPNPIDTKLFNKVMFLHDGKKVFSSPKRFEID